MDLHFPYNITKIVIVVHKHYLMTSIGQMLVYFFRKFVLLDMVTGLYANPRKQPLVSLSNLHTV